MKYEELTSKIIKIFYRVYNELGYGFLEKVYENAMLIEFRKEEIKCMSQCSIKVFYKGEIVGDYVADFFVENKIIVEIKSVKNLLEVHNDQLINYLTATDKEVGLLLNFGSKPEIKRRIFDNELKKYDFSGV